MKTHLCPKCGIPGIAVDSISGFTRLVCHPCRLRFEQPTDHPAHEGFRLFDRNEPVAQCGPPQSARSDNVQRFDRTLPRRRPSSIFEPRCVRTNRPGSAVASPSERRRAKR